MKPSRITLCSQVLGSVAHHGLHRLTDTAAPGARVKGRRRAALGFRESGFIQLPVKRHRGEPGHTRDTRDTRAHATGTPVHVHVHLPLSYRFKDTGGSRDTHGTHKRTRGHTEDTDEPHNHPNPSTTHPHYHATAETAADSTAARTANQQ